MGTATWERYCAKKVAVQAVQGLAYVTIEYATDDRTSDTNAVLMAQVSQPKVSLISKETKINPGIQIVAWRLAKLAVPTPQSRI